MSVAVVKKIAREHLNALTPAVPIAWESVPFTPPASMYLRTQFFVHPPEDPTISDMYYRERVQLQVFVNAPGGVGVGSADEKAEAIRKHFKKGTTWVDIPSGMRVYVLRTPQQSGSVVLGDRVVVPVLINLVGEVYS